MQEHEAVGTTPTAPRHPIPRAGDAVGFAADCLLFSAFVIALGVPIYYHFGLRSGTWLSLAYVLSAAALPAVAPFVVWLLHWGCPVPRRVRRVAVTAETFALPALLVTATVVTAGLDIALVGISVMSFVGGVVIVVAGGRFREFPSRPRLWAARMVFAVLTPLLLLCLTNGLPHGLDAISGWSIPVPVALAGALGAGRGFWRQMRLRDKRRI